MSKDQVSGPPVPTGNHFGTIGGVFTPSILTIFGVIMFMRAGHVTGKAGVIGALLILVVSKAITTLTSLSISAISTNTAVRGGGAYFLISRTLGPEFGGTIGIALFLAQSLSVPFYILGFGEALIRTYPGLRDSFLWITLSTAAILFIITWVGAGWAIKAQYFIMAVLFLSIVAFLGGSFSRFEIEIFKTNLQPDADSDFWRLFAVYFPAVTGIMAGINMSGDLKDPMRSIPRGTLAAIAVGFVVYALEIIALGGSASRQDLIDRPYEVLKDHALLNSGFLVAAGVYSATLSSAIGSFMGAPRILQALARDHLLPIFRPFAKGTAKGDEPRRALVATMVLTIGVLLLAGNSAGGGAFNFVAIIVTMFFLLTYGMTNLAAFVESYGRNPSFRPRFRIYHWSTAMLGTVGCAGAAWLIDPISAVLAFIVVTGIYLTIQRHILDVTFGDARRGFQYSRVRKGLLHLTGKAVHPKNWRPTILVLSGRPESRPTLVLYSVWFECGRGILSLVEFLVGGQEDISGRRIDTFRKLESFVKENEIDAFPEVVVVDDFDRGVNVFLQSHSLGPIKPNIVMLGWSEDPNREAAFVNILQTVIRLGKSALVLYDQGLPAWGNRRIDLWWRGQRNGSLMIILAHMLQSNQDWENSEIRVMRAVRDEASRQEAVAELKSLIDAARVDATVEVVVSSQPFAKILHEQSEGSTVVFLGLHIGDAIDPHLFYEKTGQLLERMPTTILVASSGEADLLA